MEDLFQTSPVNQAVGLRDLMLKRQQQQQEMAAAQQKMDLEKQLFPEELRKVQLNNDTTSAQLPGIKARSAMFEDDATFSRKTLVPKIDAEIKALHGKINKQDLEELINTGNAYLQAGTLLKDIPGVASHATAKKILGKYYLPEFDQVTPAALGSVFEMIGGKMVQAQPGFMQKQILQDDKQAGVDAQLEKKLNAQKEMALYRAELQKKLQELKPQADKDPKTARAIANKLFLAAQEEKDPDRKALLMEQANGFNEIAFAEIERRAQAGAAAKPDLGALGINTNPMPLVPGLPGAQPQQTPQPAAAKPSSLADLQKLYPGVPPEKLKEAFKKKFGVDLQ
jgi:hypothetical protein